MIDTDEIRRALEHDAPVPDTNAGESWDGVPGRARRLRRRRTTRRVVALTAIVVATFGVAAIVQSSTDDGSRSIVATPPAPDPTIPPTMTIPAPTYDPNAIRGVDALAADSEGGLYLAQPSTHEVLYRSPDGAIRVVAGTGDAGSSGDGGPATEAQLDRPISLALAADGTLYIADQERNIVRVVDPGGTIHTVHAAIPAVSGLALAPDDQLYVLGNAGVYLVDGDQARLVIPGGRISVNGQDEAFFPSAVAVGADGDLWVAGFSPKQLAHFDANGNLLEARDDVYVDPGQGLGILPDGRVIVADYGRFAVNAIAPGELVGAQLAEDNLGPQGVHYRPTCVTVAANGTVYACTGGGGAPPDGGVLRIDPDGTVTVLTR